MKLDACSVPAAWTASQQRWYAAFVLQCSAISSDEMDAQIDVPAVLAALAIKPVDECLLMVGDAHLDGRYEDTDRQMWSDDQHGRWFKTVGRKVVWLHRVLARQIYGRGPTDGEVTSHICGNCGCLRLQHIRYQSKQDDVRDKHHHRKHGTSTIRPDSLAVLMS